MYEITDALALVQAVKVFPLSGNPPSFFGTGCVALRRNVSRKCSV